jgi:hypothetical protein
VFYPSFGDKFLPPRPQIFGKSEVGQKFTLHPVGLKLGVSVIIIICQDLVTQYNLGLKVKGRSCLKGVPT